MGKALGLFFFLFLFVLPVTVVVLFIKFLSKKTKQRRASSWKGKLVDKDHTEYEDDDSSITNDLYTLYFETDKGEKIKLNVLKNIYDEFKVGDKAEKETGQLNPKKIR